MLFLGSARESIRYSLRPLHKSGRHSRGCAVSEDCQCGEIFGAYVDSRRLLRYTENSKRWFDLSLISAYGKLRADKLKFQNRQTYQELVFEGLGFRFAGETIFAAGTDRDRAIRRCCYSSRCRADLADEKVGLLRRAKTAA